MEFLRFLRASQGKRLACSWRGVHFHGQKRTRLVVSALHWPSGITGCADSHSRALAGGGATRGHPRPCDGGSARGQPGYDRERVDCCLSADPERAPQIADNPFLLVAMAAGKTLENIY